MGWTQKVAVTPYRNRDDTLNPLEIELNRCSPTRSWVCVEIYVTPTPKIETALGRIVLIECVIDWPFTMCRTVYIYTGDLRTILTYYNSNYTRYFLIQRILKIQCFYASFLVETCRNVFKLSAESETLFGKSFPYRPKTHRRFLLRFLDKSLFLAM